MQKSILELLTMPEVKKIDFEPKKFGPVSKQAEFNLLAGDEDEGLESLKMAFLQARVAGAKEGIANGSTVDGDAFFDDLESGKLN